MRRRARRSTPACRRSTAALTCGLSPAARGSRPGFLGRGRNVRSVKSPFRRRSARSCKRALPAPACPSPVVAPHGPLVVADRMMPGTARERNANPRAGTALAPVFGCASRTRPSSERDSQRLCNLFRDHSQWPCHDSSDLLLVRIFHRVAAFAGRCRPAHPLSLDLPGQADANRCPT